MTCRGIVRDGRIELDDEVTLPEGTRVEVVTIGGTEQTAPNQALLDWLESAAELRRRLPMTSDSTELLREIREERSNR